MQTEAILPERIQSLNDRPPSDDGAYVLYWMDQSHRVNNNEAFIYAVRQANEHAVPLLVCAVVANDTNQRFTSRQFKWLWQGLHDVRTKLQEKGIAFILRHGVPPEIVVPLSQKAVLTVCDRGYLRHQRKWRRQVAEKIDNALLQVETNLIIPVDSASNKAEYAAHTLRKKITEKTARYLTLAPETDIQHPATASSLNLSGLEDIACADVEQKLNIDTSVPPVKGVTGGECQAHEELHTFVQERLCGYADKSNQPGTEKISRLSRYLHFGHISPVTIAIAVQHAETCTAEDRDAFLEELVVRRELAHNFVYFNAQYDQFAGLPAWALNTLNEHKSDQRAYHYTISQLEDARTHDPYWNAAMKEMRYTGFMHNYMRMYWGKKIIEWSNTPEEAFDTAIRLNNKYFIDGWDANSYTGVGWVFGLHDRPWKERPIFGKVRYMSASGLERKAHPQAYIEKVERLVSEQQK